MTATKPRRCTVRFAIVAVVCLLLGAATTVGVAWWAARPHRLLGAGGAAPFMTTFGIGRMPGFSVPVGPGVEPTRLPQDDVLRLPGGRWEQTLLMNRAHMDSLESVLVGGWPLPALQSTRRFRFDAAKATPAAPPGTFLSVAEGIGAPRWWGRFHDCLPIMPLFPGFAADMALYAAAWYLLLFTPLPLYRVGRRRFRVSRGMCPACGYDLNGSPTGPCPECGRLPVASS